MQWTVRGRGEVIEMLPIGAITSVVTKKVLPGRAMLTVSSGVRAIEFRVKRATAEQAATVLTQIVAQLPAPKLNHSQGAHPGSIVDELMSLKWLRDNGIMTATDFDEQSTRLLGLLGVTDKPRAQRL